MFEELIAYYEHDYDESVRLYRTRMDNVEYLTTMKYITDICMPGSEILDACAGAGVYSFPLAKMGYAVTAGDLVEHNTEKIRSRQETDPVLKKIYTGNIMDLSMFNDECFDAVLNLGSFYHLQREDERIRSINESLRVLKTGGYYFLAYINKYSNYVKFNKMMKDNFMMFENYLNCGYNGSNDVFYAVSPEDIESVMSGFKVQQVNHIAVDGLKFVMYDTVNTFDDHEFEQYLKIHYRTCEIRSLLGYSEHGLYIGKKLSIVL